MGRQLYDNTNNGIEAQNKTFKYSFLNCCQNMSMSRLIYLPIHVFVPARSKAVCIFKSILYNETFLEMNYDNAICFEGMLHAMLKCHRALWIPNIAKCLNTCKGATLVCAALHFPPEKCC